MSLIDESIPVGFCQCGCGATTTIAKRTVSKLRYFKGRPVRYLAAHSRHDTTPKIDAFSRYALNETTGCWLWSGPVNNHGYGVLVRDGKNIYAHRFFYEAYIGSIPNGLELDHLCKTPRCVNPAHLEPVTHAVNIQRCKKLTKLTQQLVDEIRALHRSGISQRELSQRFGIHNSHTSRLINNRKWKI